MAWDVLKVVFALEALLVYAFGFLISFEYSVKCGKGFVGKSGKCFQVAPDQVCMKAVSEDQIMQVRLDAFVANNLLNYGAKRRFVRDQYS